MAVGIQQVPQSFVDFAGIDSTGRAAPQPAGGGAALEALADGALTRIQDGFRSGEAVNLSLSEAAVALLRANTSAADVPTQATTTGDRLANLFTRSPLERPASNITNLAETAAFEQIILSGATSPDGIALSGPTIGSGIRIANGVALALQGIVEAAASTAVPSLTSTTNAIRSFEAASRLVPLSDTSGSTSTSDTDGITTDTTTTTQIQPATTGSASNTQTLVVGA